MIERFKRSADKAHFIIQTVLDNDLAARDGEDHSFFAQFNKVDHIEFVVVAYRNNMAIGCGAVKTYSENTMEIKRMITLDNYRGRGTASMILKELEKWCNELSYEKCILETGMKQPEAIGLYKKNGYRIIPNYGQYTDITESKCFEKILK